MSDMTSWIPLETMDVVRSSLPDSLAFCDSTGDDLYRDETDIELSHWYPNRTPVEYRADTSTEMVLRFVARHPDHQYVGAGAHCDTDAALSLFSLVEPAQATENAALIAATAATGDFGFWPDDDAVALYSAVRSAWEPQPGDGTGDRFERSFGAIRSVLGGAAASSDTQARCDELAGVTRVEVSPRFVAYVVDEPHAPANLTGLAQASRFDQPIGDVAWASHRTRNRLDRERVQLLSIPSDGGWVHTIWYPQYLPWDTSTLWRPDGLQHTGARLEWRWSLPALDEALLELGGWTRADLLAPWAPDFPILASSGRPSAASPDDVMGVVASVW